VPPRTRIARLSGWILVAAIPVAGFAQNLPPVTTTPLAPPPQYAPPSYTQQTPAAPPAATPAAPSDTGTPSSVSPPAGPGPAVVPNTWVPQQAAVLQGLDKVNAQSATFTVKVGQTGTFGSLTVAVQACNVRPPDQAADAASYLVVTDSHADQPGFKGWMLKNEPEVSMLEHPVYDLRLMGCTP
jgi:hypothetical protein